MGLLSLMEIILLCPIILLLYSICKSLLSCSKFYYPDELIKRGTESKRRILFVGGYFDGKIGKGWFTRRVHCSTLFIVKLC